MVEASVQSQSYKALYDGLQINPDPVCGYRQFIIEYEVTEDVTVATGKTLANTSKGAGGCILNIIYRIIAISLTRQEIALHE